MWYGNLIFFIILIVTFFTLLFLFSFPATDNVTQQNNIFFSVNENLKTVILYSDKFCKFKVVPFNTESSYDRNGKIYINPQVYTNIESLTKEALIQLSSFLNEKYDKTSQVEIFFELESIYEKLKNQGKLINV